MCKGVEYPPHLTRLLTKILSYKLDPETKQAALNSFISINVMLLY